MKLTQHQLEENEKFFNRVASMTSMYLWPETGLFFIIENGTFICDSKEAFETLKDNTPESFHHKIKMK